MRANILAAIMAGVDRGLSPVSPLTVSEVGSYSANPFGSGLIGYYDLQVSTDGYLAVSSQKQGSVVLFNVNDPANLSIAGLLNLGGGADCRFVSSPNNLDTVYVACLTGKKIFKTNCSGRGTPVLTGTLTDATNLQNVIGLICKDANVGFTCGIGASSSSGNGIINSLNLTGSNPVITQTVTDILLRNAQYLCLAGTGNKFLVVTSVGGGGSIPNITVWDVSTPSAMTYVTKYDFPGGAQYPVYDNGYLYVPYTDSPATGRFLAVLSMDASTGALALVGSCAAGVGQKVIKVGNYIWGCGQWKLTGFSTSGIWAVNVTDPANPTLAYASPQSQSEARGIWFVPGGDKLYTSEDTGAKIHVYQISPTT